MMRRSSTPKSTNNKVNGKGFSKRKAHKKAAEDQSSIISRLSFESIENGIVTLKVKGKSLKWVFLPYQAWIYSILTIMTAIQFSIILPRQLYL